MKIIGIDYGDRRIGIALSDSLNMFAHAQEVLENKGDANNIKRIMDIVKANNTDTIVIGYPLNMNGTEGEKCGVINAFVEELEKFFDGKIIKWDERLTTVSATKMLLEYDLSRKKRKNVVDKIAACYILQGYLDSIR